MSVNGHDAALEAMKDALQASLPARVVTRELIDPANAPEADLEKGVICLVSSGGGGFANYLGREGDLGELKVSLVAFVLVDEQASPLEVERAELAVLGDVLGWINSPAVAPMDVVLPGDWAQSQQLEHPHGWVRLDLVARY